MTLKHPAVAVALAGALLAPACFAEDAKDAAEDISDSVAWIGKKCPAQRLQVVAGAVAAINAMPGRDGRGVLSGIDNFDAEVAALLARPEEAAMADATIAAAINGALAVIDPSASYIDSKAFDAKRPRAPAAPRPTAVQWRREGDVAVISVSHILEDSGKAVADAVQAVRKDGAPKGYVLDLRGNTGGMLFQVPEIAGVFIGKKQSGSVLPADTCFREEGMVLEAGKGARDETHGAPVVVLIDRMTAVGAELIAAALSGNGRAKLVGERTYGRDNVDTVMFANERVVLRVPTGRLVGPGGMSLKDGLVPDIVTAARTDDADPALEAALELLAGS